MTALTGTFLAKACEILRRFQAVWCCSVQHNAEVMAMNLNDGDLLLPIDERSPNVGRSYLSMMSWPTYQGGSLQGDSLGNGSWIRRYITLEQLLTLAWQRVAKQGPSSCLEVS